MSGELKKFEYTTESGNKVTTQFCVECGTSLFWNVEIFPGMTGIGGGTFDPPTFWYNINREVFCRSKAYFSKNEIGAKFETSPTFNKIKDISNSINSETLILFWQFAIKTLDELDIVSNQNLSIEMFLIRLMHLKS